MFKRIATAALVVGAALTVLPAGAFAQERYEYGYRAPSDYQYDRQEFRERVRHEEREREIRAREWREHERREHERREHAWREEYRDRRYQEGYRDWR